MVTFESLLLYHSTVVCILLLLTLSLSIVAYILQLVFALLPIVYEGRPDLHLFPV